MSGGLKIGLALGSGGARGLAHAGVLEALEEAGIRPHFVAGTSMGAIVGALYAQDPDPAAVWTRLKTYVDNEDFASYWAPFVPRDENEARDPQSRLAGVFDYMQRKMIAVKTVTQASMQDECKLRDPLSDLFGPIFFQDLRIPFAAVALDLISGQKEIYTEGSLVTGVYASSAIPSVFPPIEGNGKMICDGGGPFRVPVDACEEMGADLVIAVDIPAFEETSFSTGLDMILRSNTIARQRLNKIVCGQADFVIRPEVTEFHWADFGAGEACRARGYAATREAIPELKELLRWRQSLGYKMKVQAKKLLRME
ncbi:MAG: patatin-like phospholipase family protein [Candidatus Krumholzibacteria bacterium]|nr:patatin-like phospholipase family protein [Candidatus Krumholzibacteria bacterium]